jgi:hypothetical protein
LPPHSWDTVGHKVFIHGCKREGLFNASELQLAAKFPLLTVEKGQGEDLPGYAEDKMNALAAQYHGARPDGWTLFCASCVCDGAACPPARTAARLPRLRTAARLPRLERARVPRRPLAPPRSMLKLTPHPLLHPQTSTPSSTGTCTGLARP